MAFLEGVVRLCPRCGGEAFQSMRDYSAPPWQIVDCSACGFVYLRNPPQYDRLVSEFAWEKNPGGGG
jgi:ribosomal protein L37E